MKEEIRRLERTARRGDANLEYLKNIVLKYLQRATPLERSVVWVADTCFQLAYFHF